MIPVLILLLLLAMPQLSIRGASSGLLLWFNVVLPTLAPFMVCTQLVTLFGGMELLMRPCAPLFHKIFRLSPAGGYVLLCGLLCGYPLGAKLCADFQAQGRISEKESRYLLSICNHPSPMFLLGYVKNQLPVQIPVSLLLLCVYAPILPLSRLSRHVYGITAQSSKTKLENPSEANHSLDEILMSTCDTLVVIGGYIMLFSILAVWIGEIPFLSVKAKALLSGAAEITTGIHQICSCGEFSNPQLPVLAAVSFGGCSGIFQTRSVLLAPLREAEESSNAKKAGRIIRHYLFWKILHVIFTLIILVLLQPVLLA